MTPSSSSSSFCCEEEDNGIVCHHPRVVLQEHGEKWWIVWCMRCLLSNFFSFCYKGDNDDIVCCHCSLLVWSYRVQKDCVLSLSSSSVVLQKHGEKWRVARYMCCLSSFSFIYFRCTKDDNGNVIVVFLFLVQRRWREVCCMRYACHLLSFFSIVHYYHHFFLFVGKRTPMALCHPILV
jgi:hypothetical protein